MRHDRSSQIFTRIPWISLDAPLKNGPEARSRSAYQEIVEQFKVAENPRYAARDGKTYCNIFAWDVTSAMKCELPHWIETDGKPSHENVRGAMRINCNALCRWLADCGQQYGWLKVSEPQAMEFAEGGRPAIAIWENPAGNGHIAVLLPTSEPGNPQFAQAGRLCANRCNKEQAFGKHEPSYWAHE
jgi:hypothetical protein